jgi:orotate phosphoribosyltransferase
MALLEMMSDDEILAEFRAADALLEGHFILSSGLRSGRYLQCARVLMDPARAERLAQALAAKLPAEIREAVEAVVSPAMGGVIIGHEMGRALGKPAMFLERPEGTFGLRRGFRLDPGTKVLMVEDVVTTGLSSREAIEAVRAAGGEVIAEAALVDRSGGTADLGVPFTPLIRIDVPTYAADALPPELASIPAIKPGSRAAA